MQAFSKRLILASTVALLLGASSADAQTQTQNYKPCQSFLPPNDPGLAKGEFAASPDWLKKPSGEDIARVYPDKAMRKGIEGAGLARCAVTADGYFEACQLLAERPDHMGFGAAALRLMPRFQMKPIDGEGRETAGLKCQIAIRFVLPRR